MEQLTALAVSAELYTSRSEKYCSACDCNAVFYIHFPLLLNQARLHAHRSRTSNSEATFLPCFIIFLNLAAKARTIQVSSILTKQRIYLYSLSTSSTPSAVHSNKTSPFMCSVCRAWALLK